MFTHSHKSEKNLSEILITKNLSADLFQNETTLDLNSNLDDHVKWIFNHIYSVPYPGKQLEEAVTSGIPRYIHGMQHVTRVALYVPVFANLYLKHGDEEALKLLNEDIKLLQIAALFHDAARESEGEDLWDNESATLLYFYLVKVLRIDKEKAKFIAESTANKDPGNTYFHMVVDIEENVIWQPVYENIPPKNIFQKIIHDADCLDILRARLNFNAQYMDFYTNIAHKKENGVALEEMAHLIMEARSLIETQGDACNRTEPMTKKKYENEDAYSQITADINENNYKIMHTLGKQLLPAKELNQQPIIDLKPYEKEKGLTEKNMYAALREGLIFARGIGNPSAEIKKEKKNRKETLAELEIRKTMREDGIATSSDKEDSKTKLGNPFRSVSMLGYGSGVYSDAGFLIINPDINAISQISTIDMDSGRGKKNHHKALDGSESSKEKLKAELINLNETLKIGGEINQQYGSSHVEILYDITKYDAIYYSNDPNSHNTWLDETSQTDINMYNLQRINQYKTVKPFHRHSAKLQAIYLLKQYEQQYESAKNEYMKIFGETIGEKKFVDRFGSNKSLPIFEYSGLHGKIIQVPASALNDSELLKMWKEMCCDYLDKLAKEDVSKLYVISNEDVKIYSMYYPTPANDLFQKNTSADSNYPTYLQSQINEMIWEKKKSLLSRHEWEITNKLFEFRSSPMIFDDEVYNSLIRSPFLLEKVRPIVVSTIEDFLYKMRSLRSDQFSGNKTSLEEKIFNLSLKLNRKDFSQTIQYNAFNAANHEIYQINLHLSSLEHEGNLKDLLKLTDQTSNVRKLVDTFYVMNRFSDSIEEVLRSALNVATKNFSNNKLSILEYSDFLCNLQAKNFLDPAFYVNKPRPDLYLDIAYTKSKNNMESGLYNILDGHPLYSLKSHLTLAKFAKINPDVINNDVIAWLDHSSIRFHEPANLKDMMDVLSSIKLDNSNLDLFNILINRISLKRIEEKDLFNLDLNNWVNCVVKLQDFMKDKKFSHEQLKIIHAKWEDEVCKKYIKFLTSDEFVNGQDELNLLFSSLLKFSELKIDLPLNTLLNVLNNKLKEIISSDSVERLFHSNVTSSFREFSFDEYEKWLDKNAGTDIFKELKGNVTQLKIKFEAILKGQSQEQSDVFQPDVINDTIEHDDKYKSPRIM